MPCPCQNTYGQVLFSCPDIKKCVALAMKDWLDEKPAPDTEALFKKFIDEFPVLSALDVFCNPCGRPRAISYHKGDPLNLDDNLYHFYAMFSCNCSQIAMCHHMVSRPFTRERVVEILHGATFHE